MIDEPTPRNELDQQIDDAKLRCEHALTRDCRLYWARRAIDAQARRGDFSMLQTLDAATREALAIAMINNPEPKP